MNRLPSLFISHGAPTLLIDDTPARTFLMELGRSLPRPKAVLVASAHWESAAPTLGDSERPQTIYDFYGFPRALYEVHYPAPGAPDLARQAAGLLAGQNLPAALDETRGLDHGAWVPLALLFPQADIPVVQLSIQTHLGPRHQYAVGQALAPLADEGVLVIGSGAVTHNLRELRRDALDAEAPAWVAGFAGWIAERLEGRDIDSLLDYRAQAPHAVRNHPTDEHLLPLFTALGAGGDDARAERLHSSTTYGALAMDVYAFA